MRRSRWAVPDKRGRAVRGRPPRRCRHRASADRGAECVHFQSAGGRLERSGPGECSFHALPFDNLYTSRFFWVRFSPPITTRFNTPTNPGPYDGINVGHLSNLSGLQAGDLVTFAIEVVNTGSDPNGAFDVQFNDILPTGFCIPTTGAGLNLEVTDGAGNLFGYGNATSWTSSTYVLGLGGSGNEPQDLFTNSPYNGLGLELLDPGPVNSPGTGALAVGTVTNGTNIVIVTYDLEVCPTDRPCSTWTNTANLVNYSNAPSSWPDCTILVLPPLSHPTSRRRYPLAPAPPMGITRSSAPQRAVLSPIPSIPPPPGPGPTVLSPLTPTRQLSFLPFGRLFPTPPLHGGSGPSSTAEPNNEQNASAGLYVYHTTFTLSAPAEHRNVVGSVGDG